MKHLFLLLLLSAFTFSSCNEESAPDLLLPSDLVVEIALSPDVEGLVEITANARNTNFFSFYYQEGGDTKKDENTNGVSDHTFATSGTHQIKVRAHATEAEFIEFIDTIRIEIENPSGGVPTSGYSTPLTYPGYTLVWQDEFDGSALNESNWNYELGTGQNGWGNNELQYYRKENTSVADGVLTIEARKEVVGTSSYTSSRLTTRGKRFFKYGRVDIRAAMPYGKGLWPALWMLGESHSTVGWPRCGEIDIMEMVGGSSGEYSDSRVHGTVHWADQNGQRAQFGGSKDLSSGKLADEFHVFSIIWDSQKIRWYLDDVKYHEIDITPADLAEFRENFFFIFNVAVGGNWPGPPNSSTDFPQRMYVDYIRVFQ